MSYATTNTNYGLQMLSQAKTTVVDENNIYLVAI